MKRSCNSKTVLPMLGPTAAGGGERKRRASTRSSAVLLVSLVSVIYLLLDEGDLTSGRRRLDIDAFGADSDLGGGMTAMQLSGVPDEVKKDNGFGADIGGGVTEMQLGVNVDVGHGTRIARGAAEAESFASWLAEESEKLEDPADRHRFLMIAKTKWPQCVDDHLTAQECKQLIDAEILATFTGSDINITSHIIHTRTRKDKNYNYVVIRTAQASGRVVGVYGNGQVYYDFDWNSTGTEATEEQQRDIPFVNGRNVTPGSTLDEFLGTTAEARRLYTEEVRDVGYLMATRRLIHCDHTKLIAGGTYDIDQTNKAMYDDKFSAHMTVPDAPIPEAGVRTIGPWDCYGLSSIACCAMIKHDVRDSDVDGNAIQCWIEPFVGVTRKVCEDDINRICIYEMHDGYVGMTPILAFDQIVDAAIAEGRDIVKSAYPALQFT